MDELKKIAKVAEKAANARHQKTDEASEALTQMVKYKLKYQSIPDGITASDESASSKTQNFF